MAVDRIQTEAVIAAPVERVWRLVTDPDHVARWYATDGAEIDLRPGGALVFHWGEHGSYRGRVERVEPPHLFAFRFVGHVPDEDPRPGNSTLVEIHLAPEGAGTRVTIVERGFASLDDPLEGDVEKSTISGAGWRGGLQALQSHATTPAA